MLIGTHDSATGLPSYNWLSKLVVPFARTQNKTLVEQWREGCRYFDLRIRKTKRGWVFAHGLWESKYQACKYLGRLDKLAFRDDEPTYISVTYEGEATEDFVTRIEDWQSAYPNLRLVYYAQKRPWKVFNTYEALPVKKAFVVLDWSTWHTLIPIPWLWDKLKSRPHIFDDYVYTLVDFL